MAASPLSINSLTSDALLRVFEKLPAADRPKLPYVCKAWAVWLKLSGELYKDLRVNFNLETDSENADAEKFTQWVLPRIGFTCGLDLHFSTNAPSPVTLSTVNTCLELCGRYGRLRSLTLEYHGRFWCPSTLSQLTSLKSLALQAASTLIALPQSLSNLTALEALSVQMEVVGGYRVAEDFLPVHLLSMVNLRTLKLERCGGLTVPLTLYELRCLEELSIRYCEVVTFVDKGYMATTFTVAKLKSLTLSSTNLHSLPYQVGAFSNLLHLDLSRNNLMSLPSIGLSKLQHLYLSYNKFTVLPRLLFRLPHLKTLDLSFNESLQVHESEPNFGRLVVVWSLSVLVARLTGLESLNLKQGESKSWTQESKQQLSLLQEQMAWRRLNPGKGPLGSMKYLYVD